jgi:hypothetical protein
MGRRSRAELLTAIGAREPHVEAEYCGFVYYTRYFTGPSRPARLGPSLVPIGTISLVTIDSDNDTWSVTVFSSSGDAPLKALRDPECFTRLIRACPRQAHWLDAQPITGVLAMAGVMDRYRHRVPVRMTDHPREHRQVHDRGLGAEHGLQDAGDIGRPGHAQVNHGATVRSAYAMRLSRCSPTRRPLAMAVRAGFTAPMLGKKLVSTT